MVQERPKGIQEEPLDLRGSKGVPTGLGGPKRCLGAGSPRLVYVRLMIATINKNLKSLTIKVSEIEKCPLLLELGDLLKTPKAC